MTFRRGRRRDDLRRDLGGGADGEAVIVGDGGKQRILVLAEIGLVVDLDAAVAEDLDGGFGELVGNENAGSHVMLLDVKMRELRMDQAAVAWA